METWPTIDLPELERLCAEAGRFIASEFTRFDQEFRRAIDADFRLIIEAAAPPKDHRHTGRT